MLHCIVDRLKLLSNSIDCISVQQFELISNELLSFKVSIASFYRALTPVTILCTQSSKFQYVLDVLLPEAVAMMLSEKFAIEKAEVNTQ